MIPLLPTFSPTPDDCVEIASAIQNQKIEPSIVKHRHPYPVGIAAAANSDRHASEATSRRAGSGEAAPPTLIGGIECQKMDVKGHERVLGIDWIQGTVSCEKLPAFYDYLCEITGTEPEVFEHGLLCFQRHAVFHPFGIKLAWDVDEKNLQFHNYRAILQLCGEACGCFPAESLYQFCWDLCTKFAFSCTRCDLAFDDFQRIKTPEEVYRECCQGEDKKYAGLRRHRFICEERSNGEKTGETLYFGTRGKDGSGKFVRCYDKKLESQGAIDSIRWEVEFSKERANAIFFKIALSLTFEEFVTHIALFLGGAMDFIDRKGAHLDRSQRLEFWQKIIDILGSASIRNPQPVKTVEKAKAWVERSVAPSLEMLRTALGDSVYWQWLEEQIKGSKLSKYQIRVVDDFHQRNGRPEMNDCPF
jgi:hypothetical protein